MVPVGGEGRCSIPLQGGAALHDARTAKRGGRCQIRQQAPLDAPVAVALGAGASSDQQRILGRGHGKGFVVAGGIDAERARFAAPHARGGITGNGRVAGGVNDGLQAPLIATGVVTASLPATALVNARVRRHSAIPVSIIGCGRIRERLRGTRHAAALLTCLSGGACVV